jgi:hypothetical protein
MRTYLREHWRMILLALLAAIFVHFWLMPLTDWRI